MKQLISIVLRNQFNLFYRFGYTYIPKVLLKEFDGNISSGTIKIVLDLFAQITPFEYDEEYLILHLEKENITDNQIFNIEDIVAIYPLSQQAKVSIESRIDQRIKLGDPVFENVLPAIEAKIGKKEIEKAIDALWTICKIKDKPDKYISKIGIENILKGLEHRKNGKKANDIQNGNYWEW